MDCGPPACCVLLVVARNESLPQDPNPVMQTERLTQLGAHSPSYPPPGTLPCIHTAPPLPTGLPDPCYAHGTGKEGAWGGPELDQFSTHRVVLQQELIGCGAELLVLPQQRCDVHPVDPVRSAERVGIRARGPGVKALHHTSAAPQQLMTTHDRWVCAHGCSPGVLRTADRRLPVRWDLRLVTVGQVRSWQPCLEPLLASTVAVLWWVVVVRVCVCVCVCVGMPVCARACACGKHTLRSGASFLCAPAHRSPPPGL